MDVEKLEENIGKRCRKRPLDDKNIGKYKLKPFKSGNKVNTIKGVIIHPNLEGMMAYTFEEDESYVECRRCEVITPKVDIKTRDEITSLTPIKPKGYWWKAFTSNLILALLVFAPPLFAISLGMLLFEFTLLASIITVSTIAIILFVSVFMIDNVGPVFSDRYVNIHYYKKRKQIWDKWWHETSRHIQYLEYKKKHDNK